MKLLVTSVATRYYSIITQHLITVNLKTLIMWLCGPMDKVSDFESEDCGFDALQFFCFEENTICKQLLFRVRGIGCIKNGYYIFGQVSVATKNWLKYEMRPEGDCR